MLSLNDLSATGVMIFWISFVFSVASIFVLYLSQGVMLSAKGENGWKILIPVYGQFLFFKRTSDTGGVYMEAVICAGLAGLLYLISQAFGLFFLLGPVICIFICTIWLAHSYGRSFLFGLGLFFLPIVFYPILAFRPSEPAFA